ncbi:SDR family oxidoreductase [Paracoccus panacisoli]|uniref:SDR family oxidoreductase n=1 Tax=Paracoccus panacisoli TaxID=1510163 RepID=A0ABV6T3D2_9RHOB
MRVALVTAGGSGMGAACARRLAAEVPMGRHGSVDEIAATVAFLTSEGAANITGQKPRVAGGLTRSV